MSGGNYPFGFYGADFGYSTTTAITERPTKFKRKSMLNKIPTTLKRVLDPELQAQYKAGLIDKDLALTREGRYALLDILAQEKKKELSEVAKTMIEEAEKEEK